MPASKADKTRNLSELEAVILGLIWSDGPCTAYAVRRTVQDSLSAKWSGSAGAVYPAVTRLEQRGLLRTREQATGKRQSRALGVTSKGSRALSSWLRPPTDPVTLGIAPDPLRLRLRFLELLSPADRVAFLDEAIDAVEITLVQVLGDVKRARAESDSPFKLAVARGALHSTRGRLRMLRELRASL